MYYKYSVESENGQIFNFRSKLDAYNKQTELSWKGLESCLYLGSYGSQQKTLLMTIKAKNI